MAKIYGIIGYVITEETKPGVWREVATEKNYVGDLIKNVKRWQNTDNVNDDLTLSNIISVISDSFIMENIQYMKYISYMNVKWKVLSAEIMYPRVILNVGGVYNNE